MDYLKLLDKRNKLMVKVLWAITIIFIAFSAISGVKKDGLFICGPVLITISLVSTILTAKGLFIKNMMYIISIGLSIMHFLFVFVFHDLNGFMFGFIILVLITLYQNYRVILLNGTLILLSILYGYFTGGQKMFGSFYNTLGLTIVMLDFILMISILCILSINTEKMRENLQNQREGAEKSKNKVENILDKLSNSIETLKNFSLNLKENVTTTASISTDVLERINDIAASSQDTSASVEEILAGATTQNKSIQDIVSSFKVLENLVIELSNLTNQ